eukprot:scaffold10210_cov53-Phaeocystis_antarctica.AAC.2
MVTTPNIARHAAQEARPHRRRQLQRLVLLLAARRSRRAQAHAERRRAAPPLARRPLARRAAHRLRRLRRGRRVQGPPGGARVVLGVLPKHLRVGHARRGRRHPRGLNSSLPCPRPAASRCRGRLHRPTHPLMCACTQGCEERLGALSNPRHHVVHWRHGEGPDARQGCTGLSQQRAL